MNLATLGIWILIIFALGFCLDFFLKRAFYSSYRVFVAPGIILHELSHAFACLLTGAKVKEVSFFDKNGGYVKHEKPKLPIIGQVIISLAPLAVGIVAVFILSRFLISDKSLLLDLSFRPENLNRISAAILSIHLLSLKNIIILYLVATVAVTMSPSFKDFTNAILGIVVVIVATLAVNYFFVIRLPETALVFTFSLVTLVLILSLAFSILLAVIRTIILQR